MPDLESTARTRVEPPQIEPVAALKLCSTQDCGRSLFAKDMCQRCYVRNRRALQASRKEIELSTDPASVSYFTRELGESRFPEYPYSEIDDTDPKRDEKRLVNTLVDLLWTKRDEPEEDNQDLSDLLKQYEDMIEAPEGYYAWSYVRNSNPLNKLTSEEKLTCIRLLPPDISEKLFPNI